MFRGVVEMWINDVLLKMVFDLEREIEKSYWTSKPLTKKMFKKRKKFAVKNYKRGYPKSKLSPIYVYMWRSIAN